MSTQVFDEIPFLDYGYKDEQPCSIRRWGSPWEERRTALADISRRRYTFPLGRTNAQRQTIDAFLVRARQLQYEAFYVTDPRDAGLTDVSLGSGNGSATTFSLPTTGENRRYYISATGLVVKVSGTPVTVDSMDTDARTVTLHTAPGNGAPITFTHATPYRLVRLEDLEWTIAHSDWATASISMVEVIGATG